MIIRLRIENFAIIDHLVIDLAPGFLVFSGETGAGKSIVITALNLLLGGRAHTDYIRSGQDDATVEGLFRIPEASPVLSLFDEKGIDLLDNREVLIKRKIYRSEKSNRCFVNYQPCSLTLLSELGKWLIDIHGQHEHQFLLVPERHLDVLDAFGNIKDLRDQCTCLYGEYGKKYKKLQSLLAERRTNLKEREFLQFEMQEIDQAHLTPGEEEKLEVKKRQLQNAEILFQDTTAIAQELYEADDALHERLSRLAGRLSQLAKIDSYFSPLADSLENVGYIIEDVACQCRDYSQGIEFDPHLLDELEARALDIQKLKRKYGSTIESILEKRAGLEEVWQSMHQTDEEMELLLKDIRQLAEKLMEISETLSSERQKIAAVIEQQINKELADLHMPKARLVISQQRKSVEASDADLSASPCSLPSFPFRVTAKGIDSIEFLFSANPGEDPKALSLIVSGGELSRIMLALKVCLRAADGIPIMVFDEVDVGIGGDVSRIVAGKLKELSRDKQILCITHSPQIASMADHHYIVMKKVFENRTNAVVEKIDDEQRIHELARMLGGGIHSVMAMKHARELIEGEESS
ncbi:MAG: DNA repair protein RecN [bacterium]